MIYKVDEEIILYGTSNKRKYRLYSKPWKFWPFWKLVKYVYNDEDLRETLGLLASNPKYEGTLSQVLEQIRGN